MFFDSQYIALPCVAGVSSVRLRVYQPSNKRLDVNVLIENISIIMLWKANVAVRTYVYVPRTTTAFHNIIYSFRPNTGCHMQPSKIKLTVTQSLVLVYVVLVWIFIQHTDYEISII